MDLKGKRILVTGASGAIGGAIALACGNGGAHVALVAFERLAEAEKRAAAIWEMGAKAVVLEGDLRDGGACERVTHEVVERLGGLEGLVNCAGVTRDRLFVRLDDESWRDMVETNLTAALHMSQSAARAMMRRRTGSIVNVSSVAAQVPGPGQAGYAATKGGLEALTRALAVELGPRGVRANAIAPGRIESPMTEEVHAKEGDRLLDRIPLRRYGKPEDVAHLAVFLLSDRAAYLTGQVLTLDGGLSLAAKG